LRSFNLKWKLLTTQKRVDDVLSRNGYDVNAYEGLKKKEESMVESAPLSQSESEQPSETTEPTQEVGTESVTPAPLDANFLNQEMPTVSTVAPKMFSPLVKPKTQEEQVQEATASTINPTEQPETAGSKILALRDRASSHFNDLMGKVLPQESATAEMDFEQEEDNIVSSTDDVDKEKPKERKPKRREVKTMAEQLYEDQAKANYETQQALVGNTQLLGYYEPGDGTYEMIFTNTLPGYAKDRANITQGVVGDATYQGFIAKEYTPIVEQPAALKYESKEKWDDLQKAVITKENYDGSTGGTWQENHANHISKLKETDVNYIKSALEVPPTDQEGNLEKKRWENFQKKTKAWKEKTSAAMEASRKDKEEYEIAKKTIESTTYIDGINEQFKNSGLESSALLEVINQNSSDQDKLNFSNLAMDHGLNENIVIQLIKDKYLGDYTPEIAVEGSPRFLNVQVDPNDPEYAKKVDEAKTEKAKGLYYEMKRDAKYFLAEQYIKNQIALGNKAYSYEFLDRLKQAKDKRLDEFTPYDFDGENYIYSVTQLPIDKANATWASTIFKMANQDYTSRPLSQAKVASDNLRDRGVTQSSRVLNYRMGKLQKDIEGVKQKVGIQDEKFYADLSKQLVSAKKEVDAIDVEIKNKNAVTQTQLDQLSTTSSQLEANLNQYFEKKEGDEGALYYREGVNPQEADAVLEQYNNIQKKIKAVVNKLNNTPQEDDIPLDMSDPQIQAILQADEETKKVIGKRGELTKQFEPLSAEVSKLNDFEKQAEPYLKEAANINSQFQAMSADPDVIALQKLTPILNDIEISNAENQSKIDPETGLYKLDYGVNQATREYRIGKDGQLTSGNTDFSGIDAYNEADQKKLQYDAEHTGWWETLAKSTGYGLTGSAMSINRAVTQLLMMPFRMAEDEGEWSALDNQMEWYDQRSKDNAVVQNNPYDEDYGLNDWTANIMGVVPDLLAVWLTGGASTSLVSSIFKGAGGAALKKIALAPSTLYFTARSQGQLQKELEDAGYNPLEATMGSAVISHVVAMSEFLFAELPNISRLTLRKGVNTIVRRGIANKLTTAEIAKQVSANLFTKMGRAGLIIASQSAKEAVPEEGLQTAEEQLGMTILGTREGMSLIDARTGQYTPYSKELFKAMATGAAVGGGMAALSTAQNAYTEIKNKEALKAVQLSIGENFTEIVKAGQEADEKFKETSNYKFIENVKKKFDELSLDPNFGKFNDAGRGALLDLTLKQEELIKADKAFQSIGVNNIKLQTQIKNITAALNKTLEKAQQEATEREKLNAELEELGVTDYQVTPAGDMIAVNWDERTTDDEMQPNFEKAKSLVKTFYTNLSKTETNAVQEQTTSEVPVQSETTDGQQVAKGEPKTELQATPQEGREKGQIDLDIEEVQKATGAVIKLNEDGTLTITPPQKGGQSKKAAAIENATQQLANLGYNVESRVIESVEQETAAEEETQQGPTDEEFGTAIQESEDLGIVAGTEAMNTLAQEHKKDANKSKILTQANRAVKALNSLFPNVKIVLHNDDESYNSAMEKLGGTPNTRGQFVYKPSADGNMQGAIHINLNRANARTVAHEVSHAALLKMFKGDGKLFNKFKETISQLAKDKQIILNEDGKEERTSWGAVSERLSRKYTNEKGFTDEDRAEEYLAELAGLVASLDLSKNENRSLLKMIADFINKFLYGNSELEQLGLKPISDTSSAEEVLEFFETLGKKISRGESIDTKTQIKDAIENNIAGEVVVAGVINKEAIAKSQVIDTPILNVYQSEETEVLPVLSLDDIFDKYDGKVTAINSDPTRVGELTLISGKKIFMYGGPNYASLKKNISSNIGFATTQLSKVLLNLKYAKSLSKDKPVATLIVTQAPTSLLSNSYSLRYVLDAISQLPKSVRKSKEFKTSFFGKDITALKNAFGEKAYNEFVKKYSKADLSDDAQMDKMIEEMAYKLGDDNSGPSFKARAAFLSNLLGGIQENKKKKGSVKQVGYYSTKPTKFIAKQLFERFGLNTEKLFYELGEKSIIDAYMNDGVWGIAVGGFETDPNADPKSVQSGGVKHPLFNAKFPGRNHFALNGGYLIDELFLPRPLEKEGGKIYITKASQMLASSMYVKGVVEKAEPKIELGKKEKTGVKTKSQLDEVVVTKSESKNPSFEDMLDFNVDGGVLEIGKVKGSKVYSILKLSVNEDKRRQGLATKLLKSALDKTNGELSGMASNDASVELNYKLGMRAYENGQELSLDQSKDLREKKSGESIKMILPQEERGDNYKPKLTEEKGVVAKSQMDEVQRTAQMYNMNDQGFFPKNADEYKINRDFQKFGLKAKRANATSWGPGSLYLVNQAGRKVNPFSVKKKAQIDINAEESPLYQRRTKEDVPFVSNEQVRNDVPKMDATTRQTEAKNIKIEPGMLVGSRININASRSLGYPVLTIHHTFDKGKPQKENPNASKGEAIGQRGNITLSNVNFNVSQSERNKIAEGRAKGVMAMAVGRVTDTKPNFDGIELSFNPNREHLFVDSEGRAVKSAEEVTIMGFKAYARGKISYFEEYEDPRSSQYTAPSQTKFAKTKEELTNTIEDIETGNTTVEEVGVPDLEPEVVVEAMNAFSDAMENGSTIEEATEEVAIVLENSTERGPERVNPSSENTEPVSSNKKEGKPKTEEKEKTESTTLSDPETIVAFTIAGNAISIAEVTGVKKEEAIKQAVLELVGGNQAEADKFLNQYPDMMKAINNAYNNINRKKEVQRQNEAGNITVNQRRALLDQVKLAIKNALEGRKQGIQEGKEKAQKTIDALNKKLEEGKITKQELQDRIKELGYTIRWEAGVARLAGEKAGKSMGKKFGEFVGYFKGLAAGRAEQRGIGRLVSEYIKDAIENGLGKKGYFSPNMLKSISRRAATISNQKQLDAFVKYLDTILANKLVADITESIEKAKKKAKGQIGYQYSAMMKQFASFDLFNDDGDLVYDYQTLEQYKKALDMINQNTPNIGGMSDLSPDGVNSLFDYMAEINKLNQPAPKSPNASLNDWQLAVNKLFNNAKNIIVKNNGVTDVAESVKNYRAFKANVSKYLKALDEMLAAGMISDVDYERLFKDVKDQEAIYNTYADNFQDEIDEIKQTIIDDLLDSDTKELIELWLNETEAFTPTQKKLAKQLLRANRKNLMSLSLEDLDVLNNAVTQLVENGFVDEKNVRTILDRAEIRGQQIGSQLNKQLEKVKNKFRGPDAKENLQYLLLRKATVFWESLLGIKENKIYRKYVADPINQAFSGWSDGVNDILGKYVDVVNSLKVKGSRKVWDRANGKDRKVSNSSYMRVKIGVIGHILDNAWTARMDKKSAKDWLTKILEDYNSQNDMAMRSIDELYIVQDVYNRLLENFSDADGKLDHAAVLKAFENGDPNVMDSTERTYYSAVQNALSEAGEYINSANSMRDKGGEINPYYMPRQYVGSNDQSNSTDINYHSQLGQAIRSGASYQRVLPTPDKALNFNVDALVFSNVNEGVRDYYLTDAKRYVNEVFRNARENMTDEAFERNLLRSLQDLSKGTIDYGVSQQDGKPNGLMTKINTLFFTTALIGSVRTPVEFFNNVIGYSIGQRSLKSLTLPFNRKEEKETENLLKEFNSSVRFDVPTRNISLKKERVLSGDTLVDMKTRRDSEISMIVPWLNNLSAFMRRGEWKSQFDRAFERATGEKFDYNRHYVNGTTEDYVAMKQAASDADFMARRIMRGGSKAERRQFIQIFPGKRAMISANSVTAPYLSLLTDFISHDVTNMGRGITKVVEGEIKDGMTQTLGGLFRLSLYPFLMSVTKNVMKMYFGDDEEKEEAKEDLDALTTTDGWIDMGLYVAEQLASSTISGKYGTFGKIGGIAFLDAMYNLSDDPKHKTFIKDMLKEIYFVQPYDIKKRDDKAISLQVMNAFLPMVGTLTRNGLDLIDDAMDRGKEQATMYDLVEVFTNTPEGKEWLIAANLVVQAAQITTLLLTKQALPFVDDFASYVEDNVANSRVKEINSETRYTAPNGQVIDLTDMILDDKGMLLTTVEGSSPESNQALTQRATEIFNKNLKEFKRFGSEGTPSDQMITYKLLKQMAAQSKSQAKVEMGGQETAINLVDVGKDADRNSIVSKNELTKDLMSGKHYTRRQSSRFKENELYYISKQISGPMKDVYEKATELGKTGITEYLKSLYRSEYYKLEDKPVKEDYFIIQDGKAVQTPKIVDGK
jgi:hypothetical protein